MSVVDKTARGFQVDERVWIALDALDDSEKRAVEGILLDQSHFAAAMADRSKVKRISRTRLVFALDVTPLLYVIYKVSVERIEVLDLMGKAAFRRFGAKRKRVGSKSLKGSSRLKGSL